MLMKEAQLAKCVRLKGLENEVLGGGRERERESEGGELAGGSRTEK